MPVDRRSREPISAPVQTSDPLPAAMIAGPGRFEPSPKAVFPGCEQASRCGRRRNLPALRRAPLQARVGGAVAAEVVPDRLDEVLVLSAHAVQIPVRQRRPGIGKRGHHGRRRGMAGDEGIDQRLRQTADVLRSGQRRRLPSGRLSRCMSCWACQAPDLGGGDSPRDPGATVPLPFADINNPKMRRAP